ncbi:MAG: hypothetical protein B9S34_05110 [Opitutia bacterium Tous-C1TDCM]|nr:MAG: hypothetical protein B9S34_05110 [Opitutae bacterium Tous-C1TDCM]
MRTKTPLIFGIAIACALAGGVAQAAEAKWQSLFDGKTLKGWKQMQGDAKFVVRDGAIVGTVTEGVPANSFMVTEELFGDFIFEAEFKAAPGINSGVQFRSAPPDGAERKRLYGYQFEIDPTPRGLTGGLYEEGRRGWFQPAKNNGEPQQVWAKANAAKLKMGEWNTMRIEARGNRVKTFLNGQPLADFTDTDEAVRVKRGFFGLQVHSTKNKELFGKEIAFRNLRVQKLE